MSIPAAQYLRMSTEKQPMSIETQREAIAAYALAAGYSVLETYVDAACSGVQLKGRQGMQRLLQDVMRPNCPYKAVLVLDVSRWGRFQDVDESAYYEYHCRKNGVQVIYASESFQASNSPLDSVIKQLKRSMAAEYSRELAHKSRAGQVTVVNQGFATGQLPCLGYRRVAIAADGSVRPLAYDERKPRLTDRIKWVLGPAVEIEMVQWIFAEYAKEQNSLQDVWVMARILGITSHRGVPISVDMLRRLLGSEIVTGRFTWGLGRDGSSVTNIARLPQPAMNDSMVAPIVDRATWDHVQARLCERAHFHQSGFDDKFLLAKLRSALKRNPDLPSNRFRKAGLPESETYRRHFGSVTEAFRLARAQSPIRERTAGVRCTGHATKRYFIQFVCDQLHSLKVELAARPRENLLLINGTVVKVLLAHNFFDGTGMLRWKMNHTFRADQKGHWVLILCSFHGLYVVSHSMLLCPAQSYDVVSRVLRSSTGGEFDELDPEELILRLTSIPPTQRSS